MTRRPGRFPGVTGRRRRPIVDVGFLCMIRGAGDELPGYLGRIAELRDATGWTTQVVVVANQCHHPVTYAGGQTIRYSSHGDGCWPEPANANPDGFRVLQISDVADGPFDVLVRASDRCPHFPSSEISADRWRHMVWLANVGLAAMSDVSALIVVHPDIEWTVDTMERLIRFVDDNPTTVAAAQVRTRDGAYYDTWGTRLVDGTHASPTLGPDEWGQIGSAAGCLVLPGVCRHVPWIGDAEVGWCNRLRWHGFDVWLTVETVVHP